MDHSTQQTANNDLAPGYVYVMTHSFFHDVIRVGFTLDEPNLYAENLSTKNPGDYTLVFSLKCDDPYQVNKNIKNYLKAQSYVNDFYQVPIDVAKTLLKREALRIPTYSSD